MVNSQNKEKAKSLQKLEEQLSMGRKAVKYLRRKSKNRQKFISTYLQFPELTSSYEYIDKILRDTY